MVEKSKKVSERSLSKAIASEWQSFAVYTAACCTRTNLRGKRSCLKLGTLLDLCVSSLRRGHANIICMVPILLDDPRRESKETLLTTCPHKHTLNCTKRTHNHPACPLPLTMATKPHLPHSWLLPCTCCRASFISLSSFQRECAFSPKSRNPMCMASLPPGEQKQNVGIIPVSCGGGRPKLP